jgi:hypothetical protein
VFDGVKFDLSLVSFLVVPFVKGSGISVPSSSSSLSHSHSSSSPHSSSSFFPLAFTLRFRGTDFFRVFNSVAQGACVDPGIFSLNVYHLLKMNDNLPPVYGVGSVVCPEILKFHKCVFRNAIEMFFMLQRISNVQTIINDAFKVLYLMVLNNRMNAALKFT